jgi:hypothetical protein
MNDHQKYIDLERRVAELERLVSELRGNLCDIQTPTLGYAANFSGLLDGGTVSLTPTVEVREQIEMTKRMD